MYGILVVRPILYYSNNINMEYSRFFSIIIPAHNEEKLIGTTLDHLLAQTYPLDKFEIIVVINGSNDHTFDKVQKYTQNNVKVYNLTQAGVSRARNFGLSVISQNTDWIIFLDADTYLKNLFLKELNRYLDKYPKTGYGTTTIHSDVNKRVSQFWYWYTNWTDRFLKILHRIHIVRKDLALQVNYDENLIRTEDLQYGKDLSKIGKYFFMPTKNVISSARRFENKGYLKMFFLNLMVGILPKKINYDKGWEVIR